MPFLAFLLGPIGRWLLVGFAAVSAIGGIYIKGRVDGKASYQAALTRQLNAAIAKGRGAEAEALKKFDAQKELEDDGFERKD
jgi:hypothetical protein